MKLIELLQLADSGYPDGELAKHFEQNPNAPTEVLLVEPAPIGDTLARFIVLELIETFEPNMPSKKQARVALQVLTAAMQELEAVAVKIASAHNL